MAVQTKGIVGRRPVEFFSYQEILDDARGLARHSTRQLGNWSLGQICEHLASAMNMAVDGPPFKPPLIIRVVGPLIKKRYLSRPFKPGFQLPNNAAALLPVNQDAEKGLAALERAIGRIQATTDRKRHPVFGKMTNEEWDRMQFLHSAMHLSFILPE